MGRGNRGSGKRRAGSAATGKRISGGTKKHARRQPSQTEETNSHESGRHAVGSSPLADPSSSNLRRSDSRTEARCPAPEPSDTSNLSHHQPSVTSRGSQKNLANVMSHYMYEIGGENSDMLASRYYGNTAGLPQEANRQPRPKNSTLPLFSPSVISGRRLSRVRSSNGSDGSGRQRSYFAGHDAESYAGAGTEFPPEMAVSFKGLPPVMHYSKNRSRSTAALAGGQALGAWSMVDAMRIHRRQTDAGVVEEQSDEMEERQEAAPIEQKDEAPEQLQSQPASPKISHPGEKSPATAAVSGFAEGADGLEQSAGPVIDEAPHGALEGVEEQALQQSPRRASTGSLRGEEGIEKLGGLLSLQLGSRPSSQARARRGNHMGATQYKPAIPTKKSAMARGAPGVSYMFSPTITGSRPSSVIGISTTPQQQPAPRGSEAMATEPERRVSLQVFSPSETKTPTPTDNSQAATAGDTTRPSTSAAPDASGTESTRRFLRKPERKAYGSINIGALEQFLDEGEIPTSSSDEEQSEEEFGWEEDYTGSEESASPRYISNRSSCSSMRRGNGLQRAASSPQPFSWRQQLQRLPGEQNNPEYRRTSGGGGLGIASPTQSMRVSRGTRLSPPSYSANGRQNGVLDERTPLLQNGQHSIPIDEDPRYIVPADLPNITPLDRRHSSMQRSDALGSATTSRSYRGKKWQRRGGRHHEELFIDKHGFIDESYRFTFFNPAIGTIRAQEFADLRTPTMDLAALLQVGGCFWIDVLRPSFQEMHLISKIFCIHALTVEDIMTQDSREKCEIHANYYFVCFRSFDSDRNSEAYLEPKCIYNIVLREGIITFHMEPSVHQYHVLRRIRRQMDHIVVTPDWLNYAIIDDITDLLAPILQVVEFDVDSIDELVLVISSSEQSDMLLRISTVRKRIMMVMRLLQGKADVVRALIKRFESATAISTSQMNALTGATAAGGVVDRGTALASWSESPRARGSNAEMWAYSNDPAADPAAEVALDQRKGHETILYLGDVLDHILTMLQNSAHYDNVLARAHANYLAQISIELTESSNRTNDVVAKLSAMAAIVVPLNFITGMWGANVKVPGQDYDDLNYFFYILGLCLLYVAVAICWARYYKIF
ncbi:CorA metal ion transporter [Coemansia spiralis]|uniref:CorA metal ion transporter n=2 Tax=Coemansia TaxID=4863 RepID=A0A9W8G784_9FUNG|nr:CorA metal ion transporter [Coemansia umbellata]KAJ2622400.1 CorA metal ion transporter [Coemansia sp. RSA 1358]KAJ2675067.1 CorA metal ion transporter [Coemansia spiralis]